MMEHKLTEEEFRALLDLLMCSDSYPCEGKNTLKGLANKSSLDRGYTDWIDAYHLAP